MELRLFNAHNPLISFFPCTLSSFSFQFSPVLDCHCARQHLRLACLTPIILIDLSLAKVPPPIFQVATLTEMSSRRSRSRQSGSSRITEEQISDLVSKLQDLLPEARLQSNARVPSARVLQETCNYIRSLHQEVDDLSERLSELLATSDMSSAQAAIIRSLLM